jgi:hypothetical protein
MPIAAMMSVPVSESEAVARGESLISVDFAKWYFTVFSRFTLRPSLAVWFGLVQVVLCYWRHTGALNALGLVLHEVIEGHRDSPMMICPFSPHILVMRQSQTCESSS